MEKKCRKTSRFCWNKRQLIGIVARRGFVPPLLALTHFSVNCLNWTSQCRYDNAHKFPFECKLLPSQKKYKHINKIGVLWVLWKLDFEIRQFTGLCASATIPCTNIQFKWAWTKLHFINLLEYCGYNMHATNEFYACPTFFSSILNQNHSHNLFFSLVMLYLRANANSQSKELQYNNAKRNRKKKSSAFVCNSIRNRNQKQTQDSDDRGGNRQNVMESERIAQTHKH